MKRLVTNPVYVLIDLASATAIFYLSGFNSFFVKYFEEQFFFSASDASTYGG